LRAFIAIELSSEVQLKLAAIQERLKKSEAHVKWVEPKNIHLTLKFLGYITESQLKDIFQAADASVKGIAPFILSFSGLGAFPNSGNPRIVWVGIEKGKEMLALLNRDLEEMLKRNGFPEEEREYHPHLTLGRVKSSQNKDKLIEFAKLEKDCSSGSMEVKEITVMQSILKPGGPEYRPIHFSKTKEFRQD